jgi:hypothetical protein
MAATDLALKVSDDLLEEFKCGHLGKDLDSPLVKNNCHSKAWATT